MGRATSTTYCCPLRSRVPRRVSAIRPFLLLLGFATAGPALALSLGPITEQSMLGEPLRAVIPVSSLSGEDMAIDCVKIAPSAAPSRDDVPEISSAAVTMEQVGSSTRLVVSTRRPVNDPAVRLTLQLECPETVRREYLMLLDPPAVAPPVQEAAMVPPVRTVQDANTAPTIRTNVATLSKSLESMPTATVVRRVESAPVSVDVPPRRAQSSERENASDSAAARHASRVPAPSKKEYPRLAVSRSVPAGELGRGAGFERLTKSAQMAAVEEEGVVLRKRVEELQFMVERMQQERIEILNAEVERLQVQLRASESARRAAENAVRTSPLHAIAEWNTDNWPLAVGALGLVTLTGGGVFAWRHRKPKRPILTAEPPLMGHPDSGLVDTYLDEMSPIQRPFRQTVRTPIHSEGMEATVTPHERDFERDVESAALAANTAASIPPARANEPAADGQPARQDASGLTAVLVERLLPAGMNGRGRKHR